MTPEVLAKKILKMEHKLYPKVIKAFCMDRLLINNDLHAMEVEIEN